MALAPAAYVLWMNVMKYNPKQPQWMDRDRFILSNGHASMLLYSMLHLTGYDLTLQDLKDFRQWGSKTPGHPEYGHTPGVETTTGPLGQGFMTGVGMAMAEAHLSAKYNQPNHEIIDHYTYCICSDGDLMEGASHEAASLAGHLGLGKMIYLYDDNHITIEGDTDLTFTENVEMRFNSYGWHVINLGESSNDLEKIESAYDEARAEKDKPSLIILRTHIGYGRNIAWGIREMAMCAASSGIALHGGIKPYAATFFVFTDYARGAIRLSALMKLPVIYVMTHDSIGLGEDGPTHQPVEHLASLRAMPNLLVVRPADANETVISWKIALERKETPTMLVLSRQGLPILDRNKYASAEGVAKGAYIVSKESGATPDVIIMSTGSEVALAIEAQEKLATMKLDARVVSMPCWELFEEQETSYQEDILPSAVKARISIEAGTTLGWHKWVGDKGIALGIDHFGASAPYKTSYKEFGLTAEDVVNHANEMLG
ncbi:UNVERIFIED_CONTAM: hypothetical protein GTU68_028331 [Idotea baltica]|nr:hypothetical protein [Idotea baltica]